MLAKARAAGFETEEADIAQWSPAEPVDVLFSNAALHWLPDHATLFPRLLRTLAPGGGVLAVQMPHMHAAPVRAAQDRLAAEGPLGGSPRGVRSAPPVPDAAWYYDLLAPRTAALDIWRTEYLHVLRGEDPVARWAMGSSLRPYLDALEGEPELRDEFLAAYAAETRRAYPPQADGAVLLPFRRLFIVAHTKSSLVIAEHTNCDGWECSGCLRAGFQNSRARRPATRNMQALCSRDWTTKPSGS